MKCVGDNTSELKIQSLTRKKHKRRARLRVHMIENRKIATEIETNHWPMVWKSLTTFLFCFSLPWEICATQTEILDIQIFCFNLDFTMSPTIWLGINTFMIVLSWYILISTDDILVWRSRLWELIEWLVCTFYGHDESLTIDIKPMHQNQFRNSFLVWESNPE